MKNVISTLLLCLLSLGLVQAQEQGKKDKNKRGFQEKGELLIGVHGLNISSTSEALVDYPTLADQGLQFSVARFHKNKKMRGLRIGYGTYLSDVTISPVPSDVNWSVYGFRRGYLNKKRLSIFHELGLGGDRHFATDALLIEEETRAWWDIFVETRIGASARIGKRLGLEASIGVRMGTDNFSPDDDYTFKARVVSGVGLNYYIRS
ncbi:MAG: hypothetical protein AAF927_10665 [Bacteroidota bacterium]